MYITWSHEYSPKPYRFGAGVDKMNFAVEFRLPPKSTQLPRKLARLIKETPPEKRLPEQKDYKFSTTIWVCAYEIDELEGTATNS